MKKTTKKLLIGSGITAAGLAAVSAASYAMTNYLMKVALDRDLPKVGNMDKAKDHLRGFEEPSALFGELERAGQKLESLGCEPVEIASYDGERLVGHWYPHEEAERVLIAMHGWRSSWTNDFGVMSDFWQESRCSVLYVEQRGQNNSGGDYMGFGMMERYDCLEWVKWVNERLTSNLPIYLVGMSMGAATVLMAAGLKLPDNVRGIVADCGYTSPHAIWKHVVEKNLHMSFGIQGAIASDICKRKIQMGSKDCSTVEALETNHIPVLFIHGTDDHFVPVEMTYENYKACAAPKRLFVVPGADHGMSYLVDEAGYQAAFRGFWRDFDQGAVNDQGGRPL